MTIDPKRLTAWQAKACRADFRASGVKAASAMIGELEPGGRVIGLTKGQFSFGDLIKAIIEQTGPAEVTVCTWTAAAADVTHMKWMIDSGSITHFRLIVDRSFVTRQPEYGELVLRHFGAEAVRIANTHAKFALISAGAWNITIRTSMNLNQNKRWESFELDDDPSMFGFFEELVDEIRELTPPGFATEGEVYEAFQKALEEKREAEGKKRDRPTVADVKARWAKQRRRR